MLQDCGYCSSQKEAEKGKAVVKHLLSVADTISFAKNDKYDNIFFSISTILLSYFLFTVEGKLPSIKGGKAAGKGHSECYSSIEKTKSNNHC